jgi:hypothetical protein
VELIWRWLKAMRSSRFVAALVNGRVPKEGDGQR